MFCSECGTSVSDINSKFCINCGKPINAISDSPKNDSLNETKEKLFNFAKNVKDLSIKVSEDLKSDETRAKIKDFANQAQSFASEKTKDLKDELNKINEARKETVNETKDFESTSKLENSKAVASSFWSKLSSIQKLIFIGLPLFLFVCLMALFEDKKPENWSVEYFALIANACRSTEPNNMQLVSVCICTTMGLKEKYSMKEFDALSKKGGSSFQNIVKPISKNCESNMKSYAHVPAPY